MEVFSKPNVRFSTVAGEDGWLYLWGADNLEAKVLGQLRFTESELEAVGRNVELRAAWCRDRGISYVHILAPEKTSVYPQFFPDPAAASTETMVHQCRTEWSRRRRRINFVDALPLLQAWSKDYETYFRTDAHWTYRAALGIFNELAGRLRGQFPAFRPFAGGEVASRNSTRILELGALLDPPVKESFDILTPNPVTTKAVFQSPSSRGRIQVFETGNAELPRCVIFRDSFASYFLPFLYERCSRVVVVNSKHFWYELIEAEKPDIAIMEVAERYVHPNPIDVYGKTFQDIFGVSVTSIGEGSLSNPIILTPETDPLVL